jgi:hypothetical protein
LKKNTESQKRYLLDLLNRNNLKLEDLLHHILPSPTKTITSIDDLTRTEASKLIDTLKNWNVEKKTATKETTNNENIIEDEDIPF